MKKILIGYLIDGKNSGIDNYILNIIDQIKNDNVKIIYNGIQTLEIKNNTQRNEIFTITAIGRLDKIKGFDTLIKEFSKIKNSAILQIVGDGEEYNNLNSLIKELSLENKVSLLGKFINYIPH